MKTSIAFAVALSVFFIFQTASFAGKVESKFIVEGTVKEWVMVGYLDATGKHTIGFLYKLVENPGVCYLLTSNQAVDMGLSTQGSVKNLNGQKVKIKYEQSQSDLKQSQCNSVLDIVELEIK